MGKAGRSILTLSSGVLRVLLYIQIAQNYHVMTQYRSFSISQIFTLYQIYEEKRIAGAAKRKIAYLQLSEYIYFKI